MTQPSAQGPCICLDNAVVYACPRHAFMWDYAGHDPFKDHLRRRPDEIPRAPASTP